MKCGRPPKTRTPLPSDASAVLALLINSGLPPDAMADLAAGRAKLIPLTQGKVALIDSDMDEELLKLNWYVTSHGYAAARLPSKRAPEYMHRLLSAPPTGMKIDHKNRCTLDNRKQNLRHCTQRQNLYNSKLRVDNAAGYKGVCLHKIGSPKPFRATIRIPGGKQKTLGHFTTAVEAHGAYCKAARQMFGEFFNPL